MSYDVTMDVGEESRNYTCNLYDAWQEAGLVLSKLNGLQGQEAAPILRSVIDEIDDNLEYYRKFEPDNGWGKIERGQTFLMWILGQCLSFPNGQLEVR